jgi:hypothetical protein
MSLSEIIDNGVPIPWANLRVNNFTADGSMTIVGPTIYSGNLTVNGNLIANSDFDANGNINCAVIRPALPNADIVVVANGTQNFNIETAVTKANILEINELAVKTNPAILIDSNLNLQGNQIINGVALDIDGSTGNIRCNEILGYGGPLLMGSDITTQSHHITNGVALDIDGSTGNIQCNEILGYGGPLLMGSDITTQSHSITNGVALDIDGSTGNIQCNEILGYGGPLLMGSDINTQSHSIANGGSLNIDGSTGNIQCNSLQNAIFRVSPKAPYVQSTDITTTVPITGAEGAFQITTQTSTLLSSQSQSFTVTNASVLSTSYVFLQQVSYSALGSLGGEIPVFYISSISAGSFVITLVNFGNSAAINGNFVLNFLIC